MTTKNPFILFFLIFLLPMQLWASEGPRVISLMPSQTELLCEMGFGKNLVGVSDFCNYPPEIRKVEHVGAVELNLEKIVGLHPTIIMDIDGMHRRYSLFFHQVGLKFVNYAVKQLSDIPKAARKMAEDLGSPEKGTAFAEKWEAGLAAVQGTKIGSPRVYVEIWDAPLQAAGKTSFIGEMVEFAGGKNIFSDGDSPFPVIDSERVIKSNPEIILLVYPLGSPQKIASRPGWADITAVRKGNVRCLDADLYVRPGPRCLEAIKDLSIIFQAIKTP